MNKWAGVQTFLYKQLSLVLTVLKYKECPAHKPPRHGDRNPSIQCMLQTLQMESQDSYSNRW
jgi:hypothetical protein